MLFMLKINKNYKSNFQKRHKDVTFLFFIGALPSFPKTCVDKFYSNSEQ